MALDFNQTAANVFFASSALLGEPAWRRKPGAPPWASKANGATPPSKTPWQHKANGSRGPIDFEGINRRALARLPELVERWLPGGDFHGGEYVVKNPMRADRRAGNFSINTKTGKWADFASDAKGGDPVSLYAYLNTKNDQGEAARALDEILGGSAASEPKTRPGERDTLTPIIPVPGDAPSCGWRHPKHGFPVAGWEYQDAERRLAGYAARVEYEKEGERKKDVMPVTYCLVEPANGGSPYRAWRSKAIPSPRPLYNLPDLLANPTAPVIICEGEKKADMVPTLFPGWLGTTSMGGAGAADKSDLTPLLGREAVAAWPDHDDIGRNYAKDVARLATAAGVVNGSTVEIPDNFPPKWDLADPLPEGVTVDTLAAMLRSAQPWQPKAAAREAEAEPESQPESEIIELVRYADALAQIEALMQRDNDACERALRSLARSDGNELQFETAFGKAKEKSGYGIGVIRQFFTRERKAAGFGAQAVAGDIKPWSVDLVYRDTEDMKPTGGLHNVLAVLRSGREFQISGRSVFALDEFTGNPVAVGPLPWDTELHKDYPRELSDHDIRGIMDFCQGNDIPAGREAAHDGAIGLATFQRFHPVRDFLNACAEEWDQERRLDGFLINYCGVADSELARAVGPRWMIGAVARVFQPGCQMDTALILEGDQGIRKSSLFRVLGGKWFVDQLSDLQDKDALIETQGAWIIELAELDAMRRADVSRIKKYLAFRSDRYRPPFGRIPVNRPRQCIFAGTVNPESDGAPYLRDTTGGRRFWCEKSAWINIEAVERDVRQLWGEAVSRYRAGEKWWLHEPNLIAAAAVRVAERTDYGINEAWEGKIGPWFAEHEKLALARGDAEPLKFTLEQIMRSALGFEDGVLHTKANQMEAAKILKHLGCKRNTSVRPQTWFRGEPPDRRKELEKQRQAIEDQL